MADSPQQQYNMNDDFYNLNNYNTTEDNNKYTNKSPSSM